MSQLDPTMAKLAAKIILDQEARIAELEKDASNASNELLRLRREKECLKIAHKLAEIGRISSDFTSISEKADSLAESDKNLEVVKEAIDVAQNNFDLGHVDESTPSSGGYDAITEALMGLA